MRHEIRVASLALAACLAIAWPGPHARAGEGAESDSEPGTETAASPEPGDEILIAAMPVFVPPNRGAPMARLGGATRSAAEDPLPRIEALVPEEAGWTLREHPVLYWYLAELTDVRIDLVLLRLDPTETVLEKTLPGPTQPGVQRLALADHGVSIEPGVTYQWLIKLVPDPEDRSYDRVVGGGLERVEPSPELASSLEAPGGSTPHLLAEAGIWYDAVDEISVRITAAPGDASLWNQRAALFEQVGLPAIALEQGSAPGFDRR